MTVAEWSNKVPALVVNLPAGRRKARVVVFNGRPGSAEVSAHGWTGKGQRLDLQHGAVCDGVQDRVQVPHLSARRGRAFAAGVARAPRCPQGLCTERQTAESL